MSHSEKLRYPRIKDLNKEWAAEMNVLFSEVEMARKQMKKYSTLLATRKIKQHQFHYTPENVAVIETLNSDNASVVVVGIKEALCAISGNMAPEGSFCGVSAMRTGQAISQVLDTAKSCARR